MVISARTIEKTAASARRPGQEEIAGKGLDAGLSTAAHIPDIKVVFQSMAEGVGFEPTIRIGLTYCTIAVFSHKVQSNTSFTTEKSLD